MLMPAEVSKVVCYALNRMHIHAVDKSIDSPYTLAISPRGSFGGLINVVVKISAMPRSSGNPPRRSAGQERMRCLCFAAK